MKAGRFAYLKIYIGILLMVAGIILNGALVAKVIAMNGRYGFGKVTARVKNQLDSKGLNGFNLNEMLRLEQYIGNGAIAYYAKATVNTAVIFENRTYQAQIQGVNHYYPEFNQLKLLQGGFWNQRGDDKAQMVAVIDQDLAWNIFKATWVVGRILRLYNQPVRIIGVVAKDKSLFEWLTDSGTPKLYVPAATLLSLDSQARITDLEWQTADNSTLDLNKTVLSVAMQQTGKNPAYYNIIDWNIKRVLIEQKPRLLTLIIGILIMLVVFRYLQREFQTVYITVKEGCRNEYLPKVLKQNAQFIREAAFKTVLSLSAVILLWLGCAFKPYIPPRYIPDELINTTYYFNLIRNSIHTGVAGLGYIPSHTEQILHQAEAMTLWLFILGLAGGLPLLYSGFSRLKASGTGTDLIMLRCGVGMLGAVIITAVCAWLVEVPLVIDLRNVLIIWALVFVKALTTGGILEARGKKI